MARRTRNSARTLSVPRWFHTTRLTLQRCLQYWRVLASRETLRRLIHRRTFVPALEGLEDRVMPSSGQSALTLPSLIPPVMAQTAMGQAIEQRLDTAMMAARQTYAKRVLLSIMLAV